MTQRDIFGVGATRFAVGLSQVIRMTPVSGQYFQQMKIVSGAGTLEIVQSQFSGTSTQAGSASLAWGNGYFLGATETFPINGPAVFYLAASGATMTVCMALGYTAGCTLL